MVDFNPQGNATSGVGLEKGYEEKTVYELLVGDCTMGGMSVQEVQGKSGYFAIRCKFGWCRD